jgi:hypothetical protein
VIILERIDDIVATLTPEEREIHKELIEECRQRELVVLEMGKNLRENIEKLTRISLNILLDFDKFYKLTLELNKTCKNVKGNILKDSIALIPEENFYHA